MKTIKWFRSIVVLITAVLLALAAYSIAAAHEVAPTTAQPGEGETLQQSPAQVRLTFEEEISEAGSTLQVFDSKGVQVDKGDGGVDLNDPQHTALVASLPSLSQGSYQVHWQVTLTDGDVSQGEYSFSIGSPDASQASAETPGQNNSQLILWVSIIAVIGIAALVVFFILRRTKTQS